MQVAKPIGEENELFKSLRKLHTVDAIVNTIGTHLMDTLAKYDTASRYGDECQYEIAQILDAVDHFFTSYKRKPVSLYPIELMGWGLIFAPLNDENLKRLALIFIVIGEKTPTSRNESE